MATSRVPLEQVIMWGISTAVGAALFLWALKVIDPNHGQAKVAAQRKREIARRLGRSVDTNPYEDQISMDVINPDDINVTFEEIGGLEEVKEALHEIVILPLLKPSLFRRGLLRPQKGVLLYGPPGTGKTMLAKALAKESNATFINVRTASLMSKWFGDGQKLATAVFTLAHKLQPAIIFIDEAESFLGQRNEREHEAAQSMKTEFMAMWDGLTTDSRANVLVLCATNRPQALDEAVLRRLPRSFEVALPDAAARGSILKVLLQSASVDMCDEEIMEIAALCKGLSGSDLRELCTQAAYVALREFLKLDNDRKARLSEVADGAEFEECGDAAGEESAGELEPRPLCKDDFLRVMKKFRPSKSAAFDFHTTQRRGSEGDLRVEGLASRVGNLSREDLAELAAAVRRVESNGRAAPCQPQEFDQDEAPDGGRVQEQPLQNGYAEPVNEISGEQMAQALTVIFSMLAKVNTNGVSRSMEPASNGH